MGVLRAVAVGVFLLGPKVCCKNLISIPIRSKFINARTRNVDLQSRSPRG